jgi:hypothetical protein
MDVLPAPGETMQQKGEEERCNTRSTFETSKYTGCNIRLKAVKHLKHATETLEKNHLKHT